MILYFMKQEALDFMKHNMKVLYTHYFTDDTCDWINEEFGGEAFSIFKEIPDFELCELGEKSPGEIDYENIIKLYSAMKNLSESQAAEERLWAGLCNKVFYKYLRRRWKYDEKDITNEKNDAAAVLSRFYFSSGSRASFFRNSLSKYWWVGRLVYDEKNANDKFYALKAIGSSDLNSKITDIFKNYTFTSNPEILRAITNALSLFYENKILIPEKEVLRPAMQYLNAVGGAILLDALPEQEITKIMVDKINELLSGKESALGITDEDEDEDEDEDNQMMIDILPSPNEVISLVYDYDVENQMFVEKGNRVRVFIMDINKENIFLIPKNKERKEMTLVEAKLLGKSVGDEFEIAKHKYIIREILK